MELLIPGLAFLLLGVALAFFWIPTIAPAILMSGSVVTIAAALFLHYNRFGNDEYNRSTWQNNVKTYARWVIVGVVFFGIYVFYALNNDAPLPPMSLPKIGGGLDSVIDTAASRIGELMKKGRISLD